MERGKNNRLRPITALPRTFGSFVKANAINFPGGKSRVSLPPNWEKEPFNLLEIPFFFREPITEEVEEKKVKIEKKPQEFNRKKFLKQLIAADKILNQVNYDRKLLNIERYRMLMFWDKTTQRILKAKQMNNTLLKKGLALKMEDEIGFWELTRRDINHAKNKYYINLKKLREVYMKSVLGEEAKLANKQQEMFKTIAQQNKVRLKISQDMQSYSCETWKRKSEYAIEAIESFKPALKVKADLLQNLRKKEGIKLCKRLTDEFNTIPNERKWRLEEAFQNNMTVLKDVLSVYENIVYQNFENIQKLSNTMNKTKRAEVLLRKKRDTLLQKYTYMMDRYGYLHDRVSQLKRIVSRGKVVRKELRAMLKTQEKLKFNEGLVNITKEGFYLKNEKLKQKIEEDKIKHLLHFLRCKRSFFKAIVSHSEAFIESNLIVKNMNELINQFWGLMQQTTNSGRSLDENCNNSTRKEGFLVNMTKFEPFTEKDFERDYEHTTDCYSALVQSFLNRLEAICIDLNNFSFMLKNRKKLPLNKSLQDEAKRILQIIQREVDANKAINLMPKINLHKDGF